MESSRPIERRLTTSMMTITMTTTTTTTTRKDHGKDEGLKCPRCSSSNTKFCYYNNYSLSQPRYFCKTCRRYWTQGGSLRNVPVGGGSRKNRRPLSSSSSSPSSISSKKLAVNPPPPPPPPHLNPQVGFFHYQNPNVNNKIYHNHDLNLVCPPPPPPHLPPQPFPSLDVIGSNTHVVNPNSTSPMDQLLDTGASSRGMILGSFMSLQPYLLSNSSTAIYSSSASSSTTGLLGTWQEFKPTLNFCLEGTENRNGNEDNNVHRENTTTGARLLFPMVDLKQVPTNTTSTTAPTEYNNNNDHHQHIKEQDFGMEFLEEGEEEKNHVLTN